MPPTIDPTTVPGSVTLPTWTLVAAIVLLFGLREVERKGWFKRAEESTAAHNAATATMEKFTDVVTALRAEVAALRSEVSAWRARP